MSGTPGKDIALDADALRAHAAKIEALANDVAQAEQAVQSANLGGGAFGIMCSFLVPILQPASSSTARMISEGRSLLTRTGSELRAAVSDWDAVESDIVEALRALEGPLR